MADIVWDYDYLKYTIGSIAEKRSIVVTHKQSGNQKEFNTRTEFYGHYLKKSGGWLAEQNVKRLTPLLPEDFDIEDKQTPEPVKFALRAVDAHIDGVTDKIGSRDYYGYIGKGDSWRVERSTILKYKGARAGNLKPIHLDAIEEHLQKKHDAQVVRYLEADDWVVIDCHKDKKLTLIGVDKDYRGCEVNLFNPDKMDRPERIQGFGKLYIGSDKKVHGEGRVWLYHQILSQDASDCYAANSASDMKWGEKSSYAILSKCSNDKQALQGLVDGYRTLYPEPKKIIGWRGNEIDIDFMYVLEENFAMAHMLRNPTDFVDVKVLLDNVGVSYA